MLTNIIILAGEKPVRTGDLRRDLEALDAWTARLLRGLEQNFEQLDRRLEKLERSLGNE
jgi:hypothetical protein